MHQNPKFRPGPAFYTEDDEPMDLFIAVLRFYWGMAAILVLVGGPIWAVYKIPDYVGRWHTHPNSTAIQTQCVFLFVTPTFFGAAIAYKKRLSRGDARFRNRLFKGFCMSVVWTGLVFSVGFLIWDLANLSTFLELWKHKPHGAIFILISLPLSLAFGSFLGWANS